MQPSLHGRKGDPATGEAEQPVAIEQRRFGPMGGKPDPEGVDSGSHIGFVSRYPDPVLETVVAQRGRLAAFHQQQAQTAFGFKALATLLFERPPK